MFCKYCGKENREEAGFCKFCGRRIEGHHAIYPFCKKEISEGTRECPHCFKVIREKITSDEKRESKIIDGEKNDYYKVPDKYRVEYTNHRKLIIFIIIAALTLWIIFSNGEPGVREFPQLAEPKTIIFEWEYEGLKYSITETLYGTVYDYYNSKPEKYCWLEEAGNYKACLKEFLEWPEEDNTITKIASDIREVALQGGLTDDELLELTVAFVQSIPYDQSKIEFISSLPDYYNNISEVELAFPRYPYEVLYDNKGVCTDKTFLAASLIEELGYGFALFVYEPVTEGEVGHIAPAVKCTKEYSSYDSGYCYIETTGKKFKIGEVPIDIGVGMAKMRTSINLFEEENRFNLGGSELKDAEIYVMADGNSYQGIIETAQVLKRIKTIEEELVRLDGVLDSLQKEIKQLEANVDYYDQQANAAYRRYKILRDYTSYNEYKQLFSQYELAYDKYELRVNEYNREMDKYNNLVYEYNALIEDFYK
jgi:hypothetical protein